MEIMTNNYFSLKETTLISRITLLNKRKDINCEEYIII